MQIQDRSIRSRLRVLAVIALSLASATHAANPLIPAGDVSLRHDIQLLADAGIIRGPVTSWPLAWGPVLADIDRSDSDRQLAYALDAALDYLWRRCSRRLAPKLICMYQ